jgi:hypothetical protein
MAGDEINKRKIRIAFDALRLFIDLESGTGVPPVNQAQDARATSNSFDEIGRVTVLQLFRALTDLHPVVEE